MSQKTSIYYPLTSARTGDYSVHAREIFATADIPCVSLKTEEAKSFFIYLALDALKCSEKSDVILCSWGLLKGYTDAKDLTQRRKFYLAEREKYNHDYIYKQPFMALTESQKKSRADAMRTKEESICEELNEYFRAIPDLKEYIATACKAFLRSDAKIGVDPVRYPTPSYIRNNGLLINNLYRPRNPNFLGRTNELNSLSSGFEIGQRDIVILYGMDGVGKSEIAKEYAYANLTQYDSVLWIDATNEMSIRKSCEDFLRVNDDAEEVTQEDIRSRFLRYFNLRANWLIIFDNAEYLHEDAKEQERLSDSLLSYLPSGSGHILITTHDNGDFYGAKRIQVKEFDQETAIAFLESKSGLPRCAECVRLAQELGHLPQALLYAGNYIRRQHISYRSYLELWQRYSVRAFGRKPLEIMTKAYDLLFDKLRGESEMAAAAEQLISLCSVVSPGEITLDLFYDRYDNPVDPDMEGEDTLPEPLNEVLQEELSRRELIQTLTDYSLLEWNGAAIAINPVLQEIICGSMNTDDLNSWLTAVYSILGGRFDAISRKSYEMRFSDPLLPEILSHLESIIEKDRRYNPWRSMPDATNYYFWIQRAFFAEKENSGTYPSQMTGQEIPALHMMLDFYRSLPKCDASHIAYTEAALSNAYLCVGDIENAVTYANKVLDYFEKAAGDRKLFTDEVNTKDFLSLRQQINLLLQVREQTAQINNTSINDRSELVYDKFIRALIEHAP